MQSLTGQENSLIPAEYSAISSTWLLPFSTVTCSLSTLHQKAIEDPQLNTLIDKIKCVELPNAGRRSVEVVVKMKDGREFSEYTDTWKGDPLKEPLSKDEIINKFWKQVDFSQTISREKAAKLLDLIEKLEKLDNVKKITELLVP